MKHEINMDLLAGFVKFSEIENNIAENQSTLLVSPDYGICDWCCITPDYGFNNWNAN
ncbi:MAG: hypothetical protein FWE05_00875 [Defluviitaleaceae bacterium]|nr:hypothetical protein [Defluviitaleaceae bacterium]